MSQPIDVSQTPARLYKVATPAVYPEARQINIDLWTPVIWGAVQRLESPAPRRELEGLLYAEQFKALADRALWAVTEINRGAAWKFYAQRYVSEAALKVLEQPGPQKDAVILLTHEHVFTRSSVLALLKDAKSEQSVRDILDAKAIACVVLRIEHGNLHGASEGWGRYVNARPKVRVWDRVENCWAVP